MNILTNWLRHYLPTLPVTDRQLADDLTLRGIAVEGVHSLGEGNGSLFEMDITTNRVDAMNHYGIAREAATIYNLTLPPLIDPTQNVRHSERSGAQPRNPRISHDAPQDPAILNILNQNLLNALNDLDDSDIDGRRDRLDSLLTAINQHGMEGLGSAQTYDHPLVTIEAKKICGRFTAQILRNVTIAPSTGQVAEYFTLLNQKQISNAVDASNFTLLGMGHPTHAFDLDKLEGGIIVRLAHKGEKLKLLDGTERTLESDDLVVADERKALALAGVMGGWDSMITPQTKNILVEAAWFDPVRVRRSARRHGLHTDASHRFERGADINAAPIANALVSKLILEHGGQAEGALIDVLIPEVAARTASRPPITLSVHQVQRHLGATLEDTPTHSALTPNLIHQYLTALGCTLTSAPNTNRIATESGAPSSRPLLGDKVGHRAEHDPPLGLAGGSSLGTNAFPEGAGGFSPLKDATEKRGFSPGPSSTPDATFSVQLPSWRLDLEREIDLIEEVARVYGYNRFANTLPTPLPVIAHSTAAKEAAVRTRLLALGYSESISSTFASQADANLFCIAANPGAPSSTTVLSSAKVGHRAQHDPSSSVPTNTTVPMENPLSEEASLLRPSLIPGMLNMLAHNLNRDVKDVRLFEQGQIFTATVFPDSSIIEAVHESPQLSLGLTGNPTTTDRYTAQSPHFFELKGAIESILSLFTPPGGPSAITFTAEAPAWLQPGRSATALVNNQPIAHLGELAATEAAHRKLRQPVFLAQLDLAKLYELPLKRVTAHDLSRFQAVERDFSFVLPDAVQWHTIASALHALAIPELQSFKPVEVWRNAKFPGVYSLLLRTVFQSHDRTLRDDELTAWSSALITALTTLGGILRAGKD